MRNQTPMMAKIARAHRMVTVGLACVSLFALAVSPIAVPYVERIPVLVLIASVSAAILVSSRWSVTLATANRRVLAIGASVPGIASVIVAAALAYASGWLLGLISILGILALVALVGTAISLGNWMIAVIRRRES